jgi:hypothetical protein
MLCFSSPAAAAFSARVSAKSTRLPVGGSPGGRFAGRPKLSRSRSSSFVSAASGRSASTREPRSRKTAARATFTRWGSSSVRSGVGQGSGTPRSRGRWHSASAAAAQAGQHAPGARADTRSGHRLATRSGAPAPPSVRRPPSSKVGRSRSSRAALLLADATPRSVSQLYPDV